MTPAAEAEVRVVAAKVHRSALTAKQSFLYGVDAGLILMCFADLALEAIDKRRMRAGKEPFTSGARRAHAAGRKAAESTSLVHPTPTPETSEVPK